MTYGHVHFGHVQMGGGGGARLPNLNIFWATIETAVIEMSHSIPMKPCGSNDAPGKKVLNPSGCYWGLTVDVEEVDSIIMVCLHVFETKKQFYLHDKNTSTIN